MAQAIAGANTAAQVHEQLPDRLLTVFREALLVVDELALEKVATERENIESLRRDIESKWNGLLLEKEATTHALDAEQRSNAELRLRLANETQRSEGLTEDLAKASSRADTSEANVVNLRERVTGLESQLKKTQDDRREYEAEVVRLRKQDQAEFKQALGTLQSALNSSREAELKMTRQLGEAARETDKLASENLELKARLESAVAGEAKQQGWVASLTVELNEATKQVKSLERSHMAALSSKDQLQASLIDAHDRIERLRQDVERQRAATNAETRSTIHNLIEHSRKAVEHASAYSKKTDPDLKEFIRVQKEIERLFGVAGETPTL
jgi:chromosome segregation ATPase